MKLRLDYVTNSSSSSYIICTRNDIQDFLEEDLKLVINNYYDDWQINCLKDLIFTDIKEIKSKKRAFIIYLYSAFYDRKERENCKEELSEYFKGFSDNMRFYRTQEYKDNFYPSLEQELDSNEVFDYDKIKDISDLEILYMNHH